VEACRWPACSWIIFSLINFSFSDLGVCGADSVLNVALPVFGGLFSTG
jgi:hypothetical protein